MSQTVVMKFGGTSVGSTERIGEVAKRVAQHVRSTGDRVVVVVSAASLGLQAETINPSATNLAIVVRMWVRF